MQATPRLHGAIRRVTSLFGPRALVLLYHRVADVRPDPWALAVTPEHFAEHLDIIRRLRSQLPLQELSAALCRGSVPHGAVVVTFDDGYADNLHRAKPLLERFEVPATVFVSSGALECSREFWWDELKRLLLQPGTLPEVIELEIHGRRCSWHLGEAAQYDRDAADGDSGWRARNPPPSLRHRAFLEIGRQLQPLPLAEQRGALDQLAHQAGVDTAGRRPYRTLSPDEVAALARGGLVEIGAHTMTHPVLSGLPVAAQQSEIRQSKARLEEILERPVSSFAYPFGGYEHFTRQSIRIVREAGFACGCSAVAGAVTRSADPYQLPRLYMEDMDGECFASLLSSWLRVRTP